MRESNSASLSFKCERTFSGLAAYRVENNVHVGGMFFEASAFVVDYGGALVQDTRENP